MEIFNKLNVRADNICMISLSLKLLPAYAEYIEYLSEEVSELKQEGCNLGECNYPFQSLGSSALSDNLECACFLADELNNEIVNLKNKVSYAGKYQELCSFLMASDEYSLVFSFCPHLSRYS